MKTEPRIPGCYEDLPRVCMDVNAHFARARFWDKVILGRALSDLRIEFYMRQGRYARGQFKAPGNTPLNRLIWSA